MLIKKFKSQIKSEQNIYYNSNGFISLTFNINESMSKYISDNTIPINN